MKVLFHANIPSPYRNEFFELLSQKCDLTVVYERKAASDREKDWYTSDKIQYKAHFLNGIRYSNDASFAPGIIRFLRKRKYDIIVISGYSSLTQILAINMLKLRKIPYILNVDGGIIKAESGFKQRFKTWLIAGANYYLSTGKNCDDFLVHYGAPATLLKRYPFTSIRKEDILVEPLTKQEKLVYKDKLGCSCNTMILSVGQPIHRKGFDILIKAVADMRSDDIGVYIIGGKPNEECGELIRELHPKNLFFVPFMRKEELADYYKAADLFVFPTREDIWGLVINEAMAYGLPVITTDKCNAGLELVDDGENGYLVPAEDYRSLADAIKVTAPEDVRQRFAMRSLEKIRQYSLENMADEHIRIFKQIV